MLFTYSKKSKKISACIETDLKSHNILERQDIEKWIENYPDILGEELLIITTEYDKFDKTNERLDLLAIDKNGNLVIIELKRDNTGKNVELQALKYAAYCSTLTLNDVVKLYNNYLSKNDKSITEDKAKDYIIDFIENDEFEELSDKPRIIIAAKEYRPEVTASVLWLRKFGIDITCIKLTLYELDDNTIAFESTILIPLPEAKDYIIESEKKENVEYTKTLTQEEYLNFYNELIDKIKKILPKQYQKPKPEPYYQIPTEISGIHFEWGFHGRPRNSFGVELHFEKGNKEFNKSAIDKIEKFKSKIEQATNEKVIIQKDWRKNSARLYI
ncbi:MAG: DUF4268 domain-containing protein [Spirochaetales bacterium]|nr:DUF4268 domain-containing protein [Spirochaetales bacterium]